MRENAKYISARHAGADDGNRPVLGHIGSKIRRKV